MAQSVLFHQKCCICYIGFLIINSEKESFTVSLSTHRYFSKCESFGLNYELSYNKIVVLLTTFSFYIVLKVINDV